MYQRLMEHLGHLPEPLAYPSLVVMSGLPGTGKTFFSRQLTQRVPLVMLEADALRKILTTTPTYSTSENSRLFRLIHKLVADILDHGVSVLLDATNLVESNRKHLYNIADERHTNLILIKLEAPEALIRERLDARQQQKKRKDSSDADWSVYRKMLRSNEPISRSHFTTDTSKGIGSALCRVAAEICRQNS